MISIILVIIPLIFSIMLYTLAERKVQGYIQRRVGPNIVGYYGIMQPLADGLKLLMKDILVPQKSRIVLFLVSPLISFILAVTLWMFSLLLDSYLGLLILLAIGGLELYGILLGGWASQNKYTLVGCIRTTSQLVSYELLLGMIYFLLAFSVGSFRLYYFYITPIYNILIFIPVYLISLLVILAETNRAPFDLPESESELVGGFMTEHSGIVFALYFLAEYSNMLFLSYIVSILFIKSILLLPFHLFFFVWVRASLPRLRYDQLIKLCWYNLLPIMMAYIIIYLSIVVIII
jgi:NADH:ubiquinone oxidoreductase subunit H